MEKLEEKYVQEMGFHGSDLFFHTGKYEASEVRARKRKNNCSKR